MKVKLNVWHLPDGSDVHIVDVIDGMLITERHGSRIFHKREVWKKVKA